MGDKITLLTMGTYEMFTQFSVKLIKGLVCKDIPYFYFIFKDIKTVKP